MPLHTTISEEGIIPQFTVKQASVTKEVQGQHGPMKVIQLVLNDGQQDLNAEWFTKAATPVPAPGTQIEGTTEPSQYGLKFKKAFGGPGGGGGPRPRDPRESAQIQRQHSQHMALLYVQARAMQGKLPEDFKLTDLFAITNWFDDDIKVGADRALAPNTNNPGGST